MRSVKIENKSIDLCELMDEHESLQRIAVPKGKYRTHWAAILSDYKKAHEVNRNFVDFEDNNLSVNDIHINNIIQLQRTIRSSGRYVYRSTVFITIKSIDADEISFEVSDTVTRAFREIYS